METPTALDELVKSFSDWRANKKSRADRLPEELLQRARGLRGQFSDREICKRTGLNPYRLPGAVKPRRKGAEFIEIPPILTGEPVVVEIHDGDRSIIIRLPSVDVEKLLSHFYV